MPDENLTEGAVAKELGATAQQLRAMFLQSPVGVAIADLDGRFVEVNDQACAMLGYSLEQLRATTFLDLTHPDDRARTRDQARRLRAGEIGSYAIEKRYLRPDGSATWSNTTVTMLRNASGQAEHFFAILQDIDDSRQSEQTRSVLAAVVSSSDDAIITKTLDGIVTTWNPSAERMFGYTAEEAIGKPVTILIPEDQRDEEPGILERLRRGERIHHYETIRRRKDGTLLNVSLSVSPVKDASGAIFGASKIARDITQRKQDEAALREHSQVLELLAATGESISAGLELHGILQRVTDLGTQISGAEVGAFFYNVTDEQGESFLLYTLTGARREDFAKFGPPRNTPLFDATFSGTGVVRSDDITLDPRYGRPEPPFGMPAGDFPVRSYLAVPVIARTGKVLGGLFFGHARPGVFTDRAQKIVCGVAVQAAIAIDNARLYEEAQREIANREAAESRLREADRRKDEFLATLAHELRNPLAPIRQAAALAGAAEATAEQQRWGHAVIQRQVRHMSALLDDLLDIARVTRGAFELRHDRTTVGEIIEAALETARPAIELRGHALHVDAPQRDAGLYGDALRLAQILANLLVNAAKYTDPGGRITLRATATAAAVEFAVRDTGIGIAPEALPQVFAMFTRLKSTRSHSEGGLGIGLALAKGLAELHGGSIEARSEGLDRGSEFIVRIPRNLQAEPAGTASAQPLVRTDRSRSVLVADDNEDAAQTLALLLEISGHQVVVAHDGEQALARCAEFMPEFALLDIGMPKLDGYEVARRLRHRAGSDRLTLIAATGWGQAADKARAMAAGFDAHFTKPIDPDAILALLAGRD